MGPPPRPGPPLLKILQILRSVCNDFPECPCKADRAKDPEPSLPLNYDVLFYHPLASTPTMSFLDASCRVTWRMSSLGPVLRAGCRADGSGSVGARRPTQRLR